MRIGLFVILFTLSHQLFSQAVLWNETFSGLSDGTTSDGGTTSWNINYNGRGRFDIQDNKLEAFYMDGIGEWTSEEIEISSVNYAEITMDIEWFGGGGFSNDDIIRVYYKLDGGSEVLFYENILTNFISSGGSATLSKVLKGNTVQIIIRTYNDYGSTFFTYSYNSFDNIQVKEVTTLYSRASGDWDNGNNWSAQDFSGSQSPAGYYPTRTEGAIIGNGNEIDLTGNEAISFLEMHNNGGLDMNGRTLSLERGGDIVVENGGRIFDNNANSRIEIVDPFISNIEVNNTNGINIGDLVLDNNASINIFGTGSMSFSDDLILNNDNTITNDLSGTSTFGTILFYGDRSTITNNSEIDISGDLEVDGNGDNDNAFTNNAGGELSIGAEIDLSNGNFTLYNSGIINQSGNFTAIDNGSNFYNYDGATWNFNGASFDNSTRLYCNNESNTFNYGRAGDQDIITPQDAYSNLTISSSGTKTTSSDLEVTADVLVSNSSTFNMNGNDLILSGNLTNNGSASIMNIGHLTFDGTSDQNVNGTNYSAIDIDGFTLNKTAGTEVVLSKPVNVTGMGGQDATFNSGTIKTNLAYILTLEDNVSSGNGNTNSFVDGPMVKEGNDPFLFPVGKDGYFAPIEISGLQNFNTTTQFTAEYINFAPPFASSLLAGIAGISGVEYWNLSRTNDPGNDAACYVSLYYMDEDHSKITDPNDLIVVHYSGLLSFWENLGLGSIGSNSIISSTRVSDFSPFTFGTINSSNPLPITLKDFKATYENNAVTLNWTTISELNNDYFTLEHSLNGMNYSEIGTVKGSGTTKVEQSYSFTHDGYINGGNYYRLRQTDFDGTNETFKPVYLNISVSNKEGEVSLYPNPVSLSTPYLKLQLGNNQFTNDESEISISNSLGKLILTKQFTGRETEINLGRNLKAGIYFLTLKNGTAVVKKKFIVN